jgi:acetyl-CoA acetyltransferase
MDLRGKVAIVGVGHTEQGSLPGRTVEDLAVEAIDAALADAGLTRSDCDGLIACKSIQGGGSDVAVGPLLGWGPGYAQTLDYGTCNFSVHLATMAIVTGLAHTIVLCYGANARTARVNFGAARADFNSIAGLLHIAGPAALALRRHMYQYGSTEEEFGHFAVAEREWAGLNPVAIFRDPMTIDDYLASGYLVEPLRRADVTMISDGGVALVLTTVERAVDLKQRTVHVLGMAEATGLQGVGDPDYYLRPWIRDCAANIWRSSGLTPDDIDVLYIQDPTAVWDLQMIEGYGFCGEGEGAAFVAAGHTRPGGRLPLNTHGGQLSESYAWGWMHIVEAVRQLRGACGERQVPGAETALYCSTQAFSKAGATIMGTTA